MGGISGYQLLVILIIVALVFGTKKIRNIGSDLGSAVKGFKKGLAEDEETKELSDEQRAQKEEGSNNTKAEKEESK